MSPRDSAGSPFAYGVRTRCTPSARVKNPRRAFSMTCLHAGAADMTPGGSEPPGAGDMAGGEEGAAELLEDGPVDLMIVAPPPPIATLFPSAAPSRIGARA